MLASIAFPRRATEALAAATLLAALSVSAHNLQALAHRHAQVMLCGAPQPGVACRILCWMSGR